MSLLFKYDPKDDDKRCRMVSLLNATIGEWKELQKDESMEYPEECVLEVEHIDGSCSIEYGRNVRLVKVGYNGSLLYLDRSIPRARLWIRDGKGMEYKVPSELKVADSNAYMLIPDGILNAELFGDKYFSRVYSFEMG